MNFKLSKTINEHAFFLKATIIASMAFVAFFIDKDNSWLHWTWFIYVSLTAALLLLEYHDNCMKNIKPLDRAKKYLTDYYGWKSSGGDNYEDYYEAAPEFIISTADVDNLDFTQEWTRGEIGRHYDTGNAAYYRKIFFHGTLLHEIHMVNFDGGKKTIVAPDWRAVGKGRIYFYLQDGIEYAYQQFTTNVYGADHSINLRKSDSGAFTIPVFKNEQELESFIAFCHMDANQDPEQDQELQTQLFYELLRKYDEFKPTKS
ncbi:MAG: hypothetical protein KDJ50_03785 [Alphaproteobacteria bacterium]|nr:hypothetical protein [Alphaproteobacteria bacterium]